MGWESGSALRCGESFKIADIRLRRAGCPRTTLIKYEFHFFRHSGEGRRRFTTAEWLVIQRLR
jgi:hypothetical protein